MKLRLGRRALGVVGAAVAVPLVAASIAYACTALATLGLNPTQGDAGTQVQGTGRGFSRATSGVEPVILRFGSRTGTELWRGRPDAGGNISFSFTVPKVNPGSYAIIATQNTADGQAVPGTPARASFTVTGAPAASPAAAPAAPAPRAIAAPAPATRPGSQAVPAPAPAGAPAQAVAGQPGTVAGSPVAGGIGSSTQGGPPSVTGTGAAAPGVAATPAGAPAPFGAPAAEERRTVLGAESDGLALLPLALVAAGLVLTLAAAGLVVARRREDKALAWTRR